MSLRIIGAVIGAVLLSALGQLLLRYGASHGAAIGESDARNGSMARAVALFLNPHVISGVAAWGVSTALWIIVLSRHELTSVYGVSALNYVLVPLFAVRLFGESVSRGQVAGMLCITLGVVLVLTMTEERRDDVDASGLRTSRDRNCAGETSSHRS